MSDKLQLAMSQLGPPLRAHSADGLLILSIFVFFVEIRNSPVEAPGRCRPDPAPGEFLLGHPPQDGVPGVVPDRRPDFPKRSGLNVYAKSSATPETMLRSSATTSVGEQLWRAMISPWKVAS
ncbi:hypothetical protein NL676_011365 [Syzygium grande]|nr:hypothetical protein NL676_011365 [Syzygium grande]